MINVGDPIGLGLVASLSRPSGNVTGTASYGPELLGKNLEVLKELVPGMKHVAVFWTPANPLHARGLRDLEVPARTLAVQVHGVKIAGPDDFENGFRSAVTEHAAAVWVFGDPLFVAHRPRLAALAVNVRLPTMFNNRQHVEAGGLTSYGPDAAELYRRGATYVDKILKGAKPADPTRRATDEVRAGDQPQDRQGARPDDPADALAPSGSGHRVNRPASLSSPIAILGSPLIRPTFPYARAVRVDRMFLHGER